MNLFKVVSVEETKNIINRNFNYKTSKEYVPLEEAVDRILCEDVISEVNVPDFRRSTVDGYAVNFRDIVGASESIPSILELKGEVLMGQSADFNIGFPGECAYVPTGGMLPEGTDSMVMIEYTEKLDEYTVLVNNPVSKGEHVVQVGEDIAIGEVVINEGIKLRPYEIGVLSSLGFKKVAVYKKPKVAVISTGDEIVGINDHPKLGQIRDINTYLLCSSILKNGGEPINYGVVKDNYEFLRDNVGKALSECDIVLVSGGSSVGVKDQTLKVIESFENSQILVHGISIKPGKPTIIGKVNEKAIFGLPGHPLSCAIIYEVIVKKLIDSLMNSNNMQYPSLCTFSINYHKAKGREEYLPVTIKENNNEFRVEPVFSKSGLITGFSKAYGYIKISKDVEGLREGEKVLVYKFN